MGWVDVGCVWSKSSEFPFFTFPMLPRSGSSRTKLRGVARVSSAPNFRCLISQIQHWIFHSRSKLQETPPLPFIGRGWIPYDSIINGVYVAQTHIPEVSISPMHLKTLVFEKLGWFNIHFHHQSNGCEYRIQTKAPILDWSFDDESPVIACQQLLRPTPPTAQPSFHHFTEAMYLMMFQLWSCKFMV